MLVWGLGPPSILGFFTDPEFMRFWLVYQGEKGLATKEFSVRYYISIKIWILKDSTPEFATIKDSSNK